MWLKTVFVVRGQHPRPVSSPGGRGKGALWGPFQEGARVSRKGPALMTSSPPEGPAS